MNLPPVYYAPTSAPHQSLASIIIQQHEPLSKSHPHVDSPSERGHKEAYATPIHSTGLWSLLPPQRGLRWEPTNWLDTAWNCGVCVLVFLYYIVIAVMWLVFGGLVVGIGLGFYATVSALGGVTVMTLGNFILRSAKLSHYTSDIWAARIGAVGMPFASACIGAVFMRGKKDKSPSQARAGLLDLLLVGVLSGTLSGVIGCAVLRRAEVDMVGGIDVLHAARAGALGATILGPGLLAAQFVMTATMFGALLLPVLLQIEYAFGYTVQVASDTTNDLFQCLCIATRGDRRGEDDLQEGTVFQKF